MPEIEDSYVEFRERLDALGLEPVLIGALAAARYRLAPRSTTDVDFLVRRLGDLVEVVEAAGYDVASILAVGHALDEAYIDRWCEGWEVSDRWVEARAGSTRSR